MTLFEAMKNSAYTVSSTELESGTGRRLEALGLTVGTKIEVLNRKRNGAVIFKVRGTRLAVGKKIAQAIKIMEVA
ncbi:hypothetical protein lbkm_4060 [Lachnospiraceae bacterium KM106-2]|nr:hypothetical protein lbkm_4060 [Lachnospiraceae bacterium KM106-2]